MAVFLCSFNTITPKLPHSKLFPIPFASVLGVAIKFIPSPITADFNDAQTMGFFTLWGTPANSPIPNLTEMYLVLVLSYNGTRGITQIVCAVSSNRIYTRSIFSNENWGAWKELTNV